MRKILLSAGHTNLVGRADTGASSVFEGQTIHEGVLAADFTLLVYQELKKLGADVTLDGFGNALNATIVTFMKLVTKSCIAVEYHFNAGGGKGTETFVPDSNTRFERILSSNLSVATATTLGIPLRGANGTKPEAESARKRLGFMRIPCENVLHEICFLDNQKEVAVFFQNQLLLAKRHAKALFDMSNV